MIGNDIVDLKQAAIESNWQRKGFLNKVFTEKEQNLILNAKNSFEMVWKLWTMKESVYKIHVQQNNHRFFAPKKLECQIFNKTNGSVVIHNQMYFTESKITKNYIYTVATLKEDKELFDNCFEIEDQNYFYQHKEVYNQLKYKVSEKWKFAFEGLDIKKNSVGVPKLYQNKQQLAIFFSITHHGNYCAYSILN